MSPEAGKPDVQTKTGSSEFVEGIHPTDGVRAFNDAKADLPDVHDALLKRGVPESPGAIDPVTLDVPVDKIEVPAQVDSDALTASPVESTPILPPTETAEPTTATPEKKSKRGLLIGLGSAAAGVGLTVAAFLGLDGSDKEAPNPTASASATPNPSETAAPTTTPETPEPTTSGEVVASVEQYPTAAEAIVPLVEQIEAYQNYYGTAENLTSTPISEEQRAEHEAMLEAVFGPHYDSPEVSGFITNLKESWPEINGYQSLTQQAIDLGYDEELFKLTSEVTDVVPIGENQVQFTVLHDANFEKNEIEENMDPAYAASIEEPLQVTATLEQVDGAWYIADWDTTQV